MTAAVPPSAEIADPSPAFDVLELWLFYRGLRGPKFRDAVDAADVTSLYAAYVSAAYVILEVTQGVGRAREHAATARELVALALTRGLNLPDRETVVEPSSQEGMKVAQFLTLVHGLADAIATGTEFSGRFAVPREGADVRTTFALLSSILEALVIEHKRLHELPSLTAAFVEYRLHAFDSTQ